MSAADDDARFMSRALELYYLGRERKARIGQKAQALVSAVNVRLERSRNRVVFDLVQLQREEQHVSAGVGHLLDAYDQHGLDESARDGGDAGPESRCPGRAGRLDRHRLDAGQAGVLRG